MSDFDENSIGDELKRNEELKEIFFKYLSFWKIFLISISLSVLFSLIYLRYTSPRYNTKSTIQILDNALDSEMALPTAMTIFNRSMINLENELSILGSNRIFEKTVEDLNSNIRYFSIGNIKNTENHKTEWLNGVPYELKLDVDFSKINDFGESYEIDFQNDLIYIQHFKNLEVNQEFSLEASNNINIDGLPFTLFVENIDNLINYKFSLRLDNIVMSRTHYQSMIKSNSVGQDSDLITTSFSGSSPKIAREFIDRLIKNFDDDGIEDRQLVFKRTIDFVDKQIIDLENELETIELKKQTFKEKENLTDVVFDAATTSSQQISYDSELFVAKSQLNLSKLLLKEIEDSESGYLPSNLGIDNDGINLLVQQYNTAIIDKNNFMTSAGSNNLFVKSNTELIDKLYNSVVSSIENYIDGLNKNIELLEEKSNEYIARYSDVPAVEKTLRSIEREQEIKEALFLLLLQKKEEAAINFAVTKPTIKIIDHAFTEIYPYFPNKKLIFFTSIAIGFIVPGLILYVWFLFDNRIHTKFHLTKILPKIPLIAEIPYTENIVSVSNSISVRNQLAESFRILLSNFKFLLLNNKKDEKLSIVVTSSIKGEGKTIISYNLAKTLASSTQKNVLLVGSDLRNPQIHKLLGLDKSKKGLSDFLYQNKKIEIENFILKNKIGDISFDVLLSGTIPPNPSELINSQEFKDLIFNLKSKYDYLVIDSAPCLLVADTFALSSVVDHTIFSVRSSYTTRNLAKFIDECDKNKKLKNISLVLNSVGNSQSYGYKYGYQYGYQYAYKYGYEYTFDEQ